MKKHDKSSDKQFSEKQLRETEKCNETNGSF